MEITDHIDFIKEQFKTFPDNYDFVWKQQNNFIILLENKHVRITFATHHRESGITLTIENINNKKYLDMFDLAYKKGFDNPFDCLSTEERAVNENYRGTIKYLIYPAVILLKNHCQDLLNGNSSLLE